MLKSFNFINLLKSSFEMLKEREVIAKFFIKLSINQKVNVYIASDEVNSLDALKASLHRVTTSERSASLHMLLDGSGVNLEFYSEQEAEDEYSHFFERGEVDFGLRRSLGALLDPSEEKQRSSNLITFYSYKGGVGRTTALALTATRLAREGKKVFVIDCDFEAPGLVNFFRAGSELQKGGVVEYLNDSLFDSTTDLNEYVYDIEKVYSGSGSIKLMPAGDIFSSEEDLAGYLEGLSRIDLQGVGLVSVFERLISKIQEEYLPDVILVDSRTGFNNIFGALVRHSKLVVALCGDDVQNVPGTEYVGNMLKNLDIPICFVLSIISSNYSRRSNNFTQYIHDSFGYDVDTFYFDRQNTLEFIGTPLSDMDDLNDFIDGEGGSAQYQKFFKYIEDITSVVSVVENECIEANVNDIGCEDEAGPDNAGSGYDCSASNVLSESGVDFQDSLNNEILNDTKEHLPDLYAENVIFTTSYIEDYFYIRPCMEDFFIPEKVLLLGDKGTGKTAFYLALQQDEFFNLLLEKSQKKHLNYRVFNATNYENDRFEILGLHDEYLKNELFIKKFWIYYIWNAIYTRYGVSSINPQFNVDLSKTNSISEIVRIVNDDECFALIEDELTKFNDTLRASDERLIITFDRLDNIVKPYLWNSIISPLIKLCVKFSWSNICPKLFLRRDLYGRLGNLTNKNSFVPRVIDLEWSKNEIYSYFLKIIFTVSGEKFYQYLSKGLSSSLVVEIRRKLNKRGVRNQLPLDTYLIMPVINTFFGAPKANRRGKVSSAYEDLYRNIQSADKTVNLRPFLDLLNYAIKEQEAKDEMKGFRGESIIGIAYCTSREVRKMAVVKYLEDLWVEEGNELVRYFCEGLANNQVSPKYKRSKLDEKMFEGLLQEIKDINSDAETVVKATMNEFKQILIANKIITPYMVGSKTRYGFAYLYTNYLGM